MPTTIGNKTFHVGDAEGLINLCITSGSREDLFGTTINLTGAQGKWLATQLGFAVQELAIGEDANILDEFDVAD